MKKASEIGHVEKNLPSQLPGYFLLPGDPNRVRVMAAQWDEGAAIYELDRAILAASGTFGGAPLGAHATGMGGPSAEIYITDLLNLGVHTMIRVGTTGAIQENIHIGDIIINDASVRLDGTSDHYVMKEFPAAADYRVTAALVQACENLGYRYHVGTGCTCASFFTGQCRTTFNDYRPSYCDNLFNDLRQAGVLNFEMEAATLLTLCRIFGKRAGMISTVVAQRITGEWHVDPEAEARACLVGAEALKILWQKDCERIQTQK